MLRDLLARGHEVRAFEPANAWSRENLRADGGPAAETSWRDAYPELSSTVYGPGAALAELVDGADVVIVLSMRLWVTWTW